MSQPWWWTLENSLLDKHSEHYDPDEFVGQVDDQRKREKENGPALPVVPPRLTLDYDDCEYCKTAKAALEDAWDAHRSRR